MTWIRKTLDSPRFWRRFALWNIWAWLLSMPVAEWTGWVNDAAYISRLSEIALVLAALSWYQSSRVEVKQQKDNDVSEVLLWLERHHDCPGVSQDKR